MFDYMPQVVFFSFQDLQVKRSSLLAIFLMSGPRW